MRSVEEGRPVVPCDLAEDERVRADETVVAA